jgi:hypothetical protein
LTDEDPLLPSNFSLLIGWWLWELSGGNVDASLEPEATLAPIGFLDAIRYGRVTEEFED